MLQVFRITRLAHAVKEGTLENLIAELLVWLVVDKVPQMDDGDQLPKALNVAVLKILVRKLLFIIFFFAGSPFINGRISSKIMRREHPCS